MVANRLPLVVHETDSFRIAVAVSLTRDFFWSRELMERELVDGLCCGASTHA